MDLKERAKKLKSDIPAIFIALKKKETPIIAKLFAGITIGYALSPIDFIPDFIPVIGLLDDIILVPIFVAMTIKFIPEEIFNQCRVEAENLWDNGKPKKWYYAIPIILIWLLIVIFIIKLAVP
ncbi:YkvA family protein [Candidatus Clostridium radicumherbarum]|uniref:YkvA family protein n=1 Tax=Candidatus Clostridium radicumherbarum TaxID=3381662 RepID=A0ABW8TVJ0_9CLOT